MCNEIGRPADTHHVNERSTPSTDDVLSNLVRAAQQPATPEEVAAVPSLVDRFTVQATAAPTVAARGRSIDLSRVSRRTVSAVAAALLVAGTAAAAAGTGVLPGPLDFGSDEVTVTEDTTEPTDTTTEDTTPTEETTPTDDTTVDESVPTEDTVVEVLPGVEYMAMLPEAHGLCTAWNNGGPKKMNPAFQKLQDAADEAGVSLEEFCTEVELAKDAQGDDDDTTESTDVPETEDPADDETDDTDETVSTDEADEEKGDNPSVTAPGRIR